MSVRTVPLTNHGYLRRKISDLWFLLPFLCFLFLQSGCVRTFHSRVEPFPEQEALFQRSDGWTGGDGVFSVSLNGEGILWLFGDTFIGSIQDGSHVNATLVNNTLAVQRGKFPGAEIEFFWGRKGDENAAFFLPPDGRGWFWPYHGIRVPSGLYLFLVQVERAQGPTGFDFQTVATWLAWVKHPDAIPDTWDVKMHRIPFSGKDRIFGSAVLARDDFILIYGIKDRLTEGFVEKAVLLAKAPAENPADFSRWSFYSSGGWVKDPDSADPVCGRGANEFSVSYLPALKRFIMVYTEDSLSEYIVYRLAEHPEGPWSDPVRFYQCPEVHWDPRIFCYAAKGHPPLSRLTKELVFSYTTNSTDFRLIEKDARFYRPRFFRLLFEEKTR